MAYSTQKDFFHVPFMNETLEFECRKACVKLKSYGSTIDDRSWAMDETKQSKFLSDLVTCNTPVVTGDGRDGGAGDRGQDYMKGGDSLMQAAKDNFSKLELILDENKKLGKKLEDSQAQLKTAKEENDNLKNIVNQKFDSNNSKELKNKIGRLSSAGKISKDDEKELLRIQQKMDDMNKAHELLLSENAYLKRLIEKLSKRASIESIPQEAEKSTDVPYLQNQVNALRKEVSMLRNMEDKMLKTQQGSDKKQLSDQDVAALKDITKERNALREKCKTFKELEKKVSDLQKKAKDADRMSGDLAENLENQTRAIREMEQEMHRMQEYYEEQLQHAKFNEELLKCQLEEMKEDLLRAKCQAQKAEVFQMEIGHLRNALMQRDLALSEYECQYRQLLFEFNEIQHNCIIDVKEIETQTTIDYDDTLCNKDPEFDSDSDSDSDSDFESYSSDTLEFIEYTATTNDEYVKTFTAAKRTEDNIEETAASYHPIGQLIEAEQSDRIECLEEIIKALENEKLELQKQLSALNNFESLYEDAKKELKEMESAYAELKMDAATYKAKNERLHEQLSTFQEKSQNESEIFKSDFDKLKSENERLTVKKNNIKNKLKTIMEAHEKLIKELAAYRSENERLHKKLNSFDDRIGKLDQEMNMYINETTVIANDLQKSMQLVKRFKIEHVKLENQQEYEQHIDYLKDQLMEAQQLNNNYLSDIESLRSELNNKNCEASENQQFKSSSVYERDDGVVALNECTTTRSAYSFSNDSTNENLRLDLSSIVDRSSDSDTSQNSPEDAFREYNAFVKEHARRIDKSLRKGKSLEKAICNLLDAFIKECDYCPCRQNIKKNRLYSMCYKILHSGMPILSFRELFYVHKKVFHAAECINPGRLLTIIINEQCGQEAGKYKCCSCKKMLCCRNSEELMTDQGRNRVPLTIHKLERDIHIAKSVLHVFKDRAQRSRNFDSRHENIYDAINQSTSFNSASSQPNIGRLFPKCGKRIKDLKASVLKTSDQRYY